jgi:uncharacterized integral membrane protein (TIGR00698 family)
MSATLPAAPAAPALPTALARLAPGLALCVGVTLAAMGLERIEGGLFGRAWLEALVLAILLGTAIRTAWTPGARWVPGIRFGAKTLLEVAVVLLGASVSLRTIMAVGPALLVGIAGVVVVAIAASYGIGRALGLSHRLATLVACGNSICGNSAIAAVAPVIGATGSEIASSIAFTAVLGVVVVLLLPVAVPLLHLTLGQYGVLAGLTVYAVPQVLAATAPVGALAVQLGTLVKLVRVLMLGPVVLALSLAGRSGARPPLHRLVPWFILGFLGLAALRSAGLLPTAALPPVAEVATLLTILSMAALGLGVDIRVVAKAGPRVTTAVTASLLLLGGIAFGLIRLLGVA